MQRTLLELIRCPACVGGQLAVERAVERELVYGDVAVSEIERGTVVCQTCQARYPVEGYVLSFADRLSPSVRADGAFWGEFYARLSDYGINGFLDTRCRPAPFVSMGVPETLPFEGEEWGGVHVTFAEHRWVRPGGLVVDVGVGSGWSSLFLARRGFRVIAFDPALELMQLAKRYAIAQGVQVEYLCADMANTHLLPGSVDAVFAFHSLHHVPDPNGALEQIHHMLREGGCLAIDEHLQDPPLLAMLRDALYQEGVQTIFPRYRDPQLPSVPTSEHSENEGVGMEQLLPAIGRYLHIDTLEYRHIALDAVGPLYYLHKNGDPAALQTATEIIELIKRAMRRAWPDLLEYVTLVAQKRAELPAEPPPAVPSDPLLALSGRLQQQDIEIARLHRMIAEKNSHIERLERLIAGLENGRAMRLLRWLGRR
ncbi:MAG TPA: class I SAM-dependent methyltransferase [Roseiflexaceae bacterium]|nr:class I SAM-dependent methyltransferase [Roseiflexaceae bacterium]